MAIEHILAQIDTEIARLQQARRLLGGIGDSGASTGRTFRKAAVKARPGKKRILSAEARKRIADAQRKRWAAARAKAKTKS